MLIGFNTGIYQAIDLSAWIAGNPLDVLATNFGKPASLFEKFPRKDVFISPKSISFVRRGVSRHLRATRTAKNLRRSHTTVTGRSAS
jgi:hypothetical protein